MAGAGAEPDAAVRLWAALAPAPPAQTPRCRNCSRRIRHHARRGRGERSGAKGAAAVVAVCTGDARRRSTGGAAGDPSAAAARGAQSFAPPGDSGERAGLAVRTHGEGGDRSPWKPTRRTASTMRASSSGSWPPPRLPPPRRRRRRRHRPPSPRAPSRRCSWRRPRALARRFSGAAAAAAMCARRQPRPRAAPARGRVHARQPEQLVDHRRVARGTAVDQGDRSRRWPPSAGWSAAAGFSRRAAAGAGFGGSGGAAGQPALARSSQIGVASSPAPCREGRERRGECIAAARSARLRRPTSSAPLALRRPSLRQPVAGQAAAAPAALAASLLIPLRQRCRPAASSRHRRALRVGRREVRRDSHRAGAARRRDLAAAAGPATSCRYLR